METGEGQRLSWRLVVCMAIPAFAVGLLLSRSVGVAHATSCTCETLNEDLTFEEVTAVSGEGDPAAEQYVWDAEQVELQPLTDYSGPEPYLHAFRIRLHEDQLGGIDHYVTMETEQL